MTTLTREQFHQIGVSMFGNSWRKEMAKALNLSTTRVSQLANMDTIPQRSALKVLQLIQSLKDNGSVVSEINTPVAFVMSTPDDKLSDEEILSRINKRFDVMDRMVDGMLNGVIRSMIVSGAPGIGKTYGLEKKLRKLHKEQGLEYAVIRGTCSAPGLYQALYNSRNGGVVVLDDCDSIFNDDQAFDILKVALDSTNVRTIAWHKLSSWVYNANCVDAEVIETVSERFPNKFEFNGACVLITNLDFRLKTECGRKDAPHFSALLSRSLYLDLTLQSMRARVLRIKDVFINSMAKEVGLGNKEAIEILDYVLANTDRIAELSLRTMQHIVDLYRLGDDWKEIVECTKMKYPKFD